MNPKDIIRQHHYTHAIPSGKTETFQHEDAVVMYSIPANYNISKWLVGVPNAVWELSRLWAPDGHRDNLLTEAISVSAKSFKGTHPEVFALVSYADPNHNHDGGVYRAASWTYLGRSEEVRTYQDQDGTTRSRRSFHQGKRTMTKAEIKAAGFQELKLPGKHRYARGLTRRGRRLVEAKRVAQVATLGS